MNPTAQAHKELEEALARQKKHYQKYLSERKLLLEELRKAKADFTQAKVMARAKLEEETRVQYDDLTRLTDWVKEHYTSESIQYVRATDIMYEYQAFAGMPVYRTNYNKHMEKLGFRKRQQRVGDNTYRVWYLAPGDAPA